MRDIHRAQFSEYSPHASAIPFHNSRALERLLIAPTRSGKTYSLIFDIIRAAWNNRRPGFATLVTAPEYKQLGPLLEKPITQRLDAMGLLHSHSYSDHASVLRKGQEILYRSLENYEAIEGLNCGPIYIDEAALAKEVAIDTVRQRALTLNSPITMATTPKGTSNWMYSSYFGPDAKPHKHTEYFRYNIFDNPLITQEAVDRIKADLDPLRVRQEINAEWVNLTEDLVYYAYDDEKNVDEKYQFDPNKIVYIALDYNIGINAWVALQRDDRINMCYAVAEGYGAKATKDVGEQIKAQFGDKVFIIDDASGNIRQQGDLRTQRQILYQAGLYRITSNTSNPIREKRYAVVNAHFENGLGNRHLFISPRCRRLRDELNNLCYKPNSDIPDDRGGKAGHITDALGYGVYYLSGGLAGWDINKIAA